MKKEPQLRRLGNTCSCGEELWISGFFADSTGRMVFHLICFHCAEEFCIETNIELIKATCFDKDFMALAHIQES